MPHRCHFIIRDDGDEYAPYTLCMLDEGHGGGHSPYAAEPRCTLSGNPCGSDTVCANFDSTCPDERNNYQCVHQKQKLHSLLNPLDAAEKICYDLMASDNHPAEKASECKVCMTAQFIADKIRALKAPKVGGDLQPPIAFFKAIDDYCCRSDNPCINHGGKLITKAEADYD
jgi:hypothetical protein